MDACDPFDRQLHIYYLLIRHLYVVTKHTNDAKVDLSLILRKTGGSVSSGAMLSTRRGGPV